MTTTTGGSAGDREVLIEMLRDSTYRTWDAQVDAILAAGFGRGDAWIACSERMPPVRTTVLVWGPLWRDGCCARFIERPILRMEGEGTEQLWFGMAGDHHVRAVTHWKPLDAPPQPDATDKPSGSHEGTGVINGLDEQQTGRDGGGE